jgi:hypothetical protein
MLSPVSSVSTQFLSAPPQPQAAKTSTPTAPQDTVHLSKAALAAAGGDADHDGDSH